MRLKIQLPPGWASQNNPNGPATFCREGSTNALQVSWAEYRGAKPLPKVTANGLEQMAVNFGRNNGLGEFVESFGGASAFGSFGTAVFRSPERPRSQVWFISDGHDHIMATHICDRAPQPFEIAEAHQIAISLALGPDQLPQAT